MKADLIHGFYLRDWLVDPVKGQVVGREGSAHLPPKAMEVLLCLASTPGALVTRETLIREVWGAERKGSSLTLNHAISEIRQALNDHAADPDFIQTLPKRGYRLIVDVVPRAHGTSSIVIGAKDGPSIADIGIFENLKRRGVLETGIAYLVLGWLLIQVADIVFDQLHLPPQAATFVTVLVISGFPVAVVLSWFLEIRDGRAVLDVAPPSDDRRRRFGRTYLSVVGGLAIAAIGVFAYDRNFGLPTAAVVLDEMAPESVLPPIQENSIAVLPFLNLDGSEETQIFANGLADDLITRLSRVPGLLIAARGDSFTLNPNSASANVRERLRVARYLEGSVQIEGEAIRVTVQLIDSENGFHVLSRTFDRPLTQFFDMRDEITRLAVANVRVALPPETRTTPGTIFADASIDAYVLYRRGVDTSRLPATPESVESALTWFDAAIEIDSGYAAAYAGKCATYVTGYYVSADTNLIESAEASCATALTLNPNLDVVYTALGELYNTTGRYAKAEEAFTAALRIDPTSAAALTGLGETLYSLKRLDEAESRLREASGLHPGNWAAYNTLGGFFYRSGRYAEAAEHYRKVVALDDTNFQGISNLATALMLAGEFQSAEPAFRRALELQPRASSYSGLGLLLYYLGRYDEAIAAHRQAIGTAPQDYFPRSNLGDALWAAGRIEEARTAFEEARALATDALTVNPSDAFILMDLGWMNAMLDRFNESAEFIAKALDLVPDDPYVHYLNGLILNRQGKPDRAIKAFEAAMERGYSPELLAVDPNLAGIRDEEQFRRLLRRANSLRSIYP